MSFSAPSRCCIIIPTFNNDQTLEKVIAGVKNYSYDVLVINDGSTDKTNEILSRQTGITIFHQDKNRGKGLALRRGFDEARKLGYDYALTIDSDGQHNTSDIPKFFELLEKNPGCLIMGARNMDQASVPGKSSFGNKFSNFWFRFETGIELPDTQTGFRLYPISLLQHMKFFTRKFEFEIEVIVRGAWKGIPFLSVPVSVYYAPKETRISHFRPFQDFTRVSLLNIVLVIIAIVYIKPRDFFMGFKKKS